MRISLNKSNLNKPVKFNPLPKSFTTEALEMAYRTALIKDAEDVAERTKGVSWVKRGTAMLPEEVNYAGLQGLGTHGSELSVKIRPITDLDIKKQGPRVKDATHVVKTNIKSGIRWKRQLKILKDLIGKNGLVIESYTGTAYIRLKDVSDYIKPPVLRMRYVEGDLNKYAWVHNTSISDLKRLGVEIIEKKRVGTEWYYKISVEDAQRVATTSWGDRFDSVDELIKRQKVEANIGAEYSTEPLPYPEAIPEEYREARIAKHEKKRKERLADQARWKKNAEERERKEKAKREAAEKRAKSTKCPICGSSMVPRTGRYGNFYGCSNYPDCKGTRRRIK